MNKYDDETWSLSRAFERHHHHHRNLHSKSEPGLIRWLAMFAALLAMVGWAICMAI